MRPVDPPPAQAPSDELVHLMLGGLPREARVLSVAPGSLELELEGTCELQSGQTVRAQLRVARDESALVTFEVADIHELTAVGPIGVRRLNPRVRLNLVPSDEHSRAALWLWAKKPETPRHHDDDLPEVALEKLPGRGLDSELARLERLAYVRTHTGARLESVEHTRLVPEQLANNIENLLGSVEIPVGVAGPLFFRGQHATGTMFLPMATTEGALVASATRGARALTEAGGVTTRVLGQRMLRVPFFSFHDLAEASLFAAWVRDHEELVRAETAKVSRHATLVQLDPVVAGRMVHLRFVYETGDAAGQNMTTATTWHACQWILRSIQHLPLRLETFLVEGNLSSDKKASFASFVGGRGVRVTAECRLDAGVLRRVLKVEQAQLLRAFSALQSGSVMAGSIGHNINVANVVGAVFAACGQDIACVHESSLAVLHMEPWRDGIYASLVLPSLIVGTVGGGTGLPQQRDYLAMLGCSGANRVGRFAEAVAGFCLGLDLSTLSAIASGHFASAHERLGRNRPVDYLKVEELDAPFFSKLLTEHAGEPVEVREVSDARAEIGSSVITELSARRNTGKLLGFVPKTLTIAHADGRTERADVMVKIKPLSGEVMTVLHTIASAAGPEVARLLREHEADVGFDLCHSREIAIYGQRDPRFVRHVPRVYAAYADPKREAYVLVLEKLSGLTLMNTADDVSAYTRAHREIAIRGLAQLHAIWLGREEELKQAEWLGAYPTRARMGKMRGLFAALAAHAHTEFPEWVDENAHALWQAAVASIQSTWAELEALPRTLIHNDFNPRNMAFREQSGELTLCAYDWELATLHVPQRDLCEFLAFTLQGDFGREDVDPYIHLHRKELEHATGIALDPVSFERGFVLSLRDLLVGRIALYTMAHTCRDYRFLPRVFRSLCRLLSLYDVELAHARATYTGDLRLASL